MDNDSGDENQAQDGEDDDLSPERLLVDDYFQEITQKSTTVRNIISIILDYNQNHDSFQTIKQLQKELNAAAADDVQRLLNISQNLRQALIEQQSENARMQAEVKIAVGKVSEAFSISQNDQDTIQKLKDEIGK